MINHESNNLPVSFMGNERTMSKPRGFRPMVIAAITAPTDTLSLLKADFDAKNFHPTTPFPLNL
ncbi:MAG: hypothetical protein NTV06_00770 [candidate division Zixibacteria bacterium]|nr:hypothetical protein [candidate division Zixibacteria bacterium]